MIELKECKKEIVNTHHSITLTDKIEAEDFMSEWDYWYFDSFYRCRTYDQISQAAIFSVIFSFKRT